MTVPTKRQLNIQLNRRQIGNKGASLVELLIVIAILAVMISGTIIAFSLLNSSNVKQASRTTKTFLEKARSSSMSVMADEWGFKLKCTDAECRVIVYKTYTKADNTTVTETVDEKVLGSRVSAVFISDSTELTMNENDELKVIFDPSSGGVSKVVYSNTEYKPADNMIKVKFKSGNNKSTCQLYFVSGKIEIE